MSRLNDVRACGFRVALGGYLVVHFAMLVPYAEELFSAEGMLPRGASPIARVLPNVLGFVDAPAAAVAVVVMGLLASASLTLGRRPRASALVALYVLACLLGRNPLVLNPAMPYVGALLLCVAASRASGAGRYAADERDLRGVMIALMAIGYTYSGATKLQSPSWQDGSAFGYVLENPLARPTALRAWLLDMPRSAERALTHGAVALELAYAPLALVRRARPLLWTAMVLMHLGLLVLIDFADLTLGMLLLHAYTFESRWLPTRVRSALDRHVVRTHGDRAVRADEREADRLVRARRARAGDIGGAAAG